MNLDRRSFLRTAAGVAAGAWVPFRGMGVAMAQTSATLSMATFAPYVNTVFRFTVGARSANVVTTTLKQVVDERRPGRSGEAFSLIFAGPATSFGQGTYTVDHQNLRRFTLFVVPVGKRPDGQDYQAVFNRLSG